MSVTVGIDPGRKGGVALLHDDGKLELHQLPYDEEIVNVKALFALLAVQDPGILLAIEIPSARPGTNSIKSTCISFSNHGRILGMCDAKNIPYVLVSPQTWQARVVMPFCIQGTDDPKARAWQAAQKLFPGEKFLATARSKVPHDGLVDAALIALWGKITKS